MKLLLTTIAAMLLIGCGLSPDQSGTYILAYDGKDTMTLDLKPDGSFTGIKKDRDNDNLIGSWKVEGELLICEGTPENSSEKIVFKFNKTTKKWISLKVDGEIMRLKDAIPEGEDDLYLKKLNPVAEAAKPEPPTVKAPDIPITDAARTGRIGYVKQHLIAGTDVNAKGGWMDGTPLHYAAMEGHKDIAELLIANGADVNAKGGDEATPLHWAAYNGRKEIVELLIAEGADVNAKDEVGETPLDRTAILDKKETADLLRKHGGKTGAELKAEGN
jgi:hypothetical protein